MGRFKKIDDERKRQEISKYGLDFSNININKERKNANRVSRIVKFVNIAIDKNNKITDDYIAKRHKYYFDLWENSS